ncbi:MAG: hypothetical protein GXP04_10445 [Alphaproteobacteria bacterium]|nr:hypothetical protein [Alphaproteobacteria bacterium]
MKTLILRNALQCASLFRLPLTLFTILSFSFATASAKDPKVLFQSDEMLHIRIEAPFGELTRKAPNSTDPYTATLILNGEIKEQHAITLSARGRSRRDRNLCTFPPLRIAFNEKPNEPSLFHKQKRLKLVTHCKKSSAYQQYYLLEYTAYKLLNIMTPISLRVRMAEIDYVEAGSGKTIATRIGFFIEDTDDAAKRNDMKEIDLPDIDMPQLNTQAAARYALFQYMIGNLDWSMHNGPEDRDCCHNTKLVGAAKDSTSGLIPVPYDFDYSGLVNAPYAVPPTEIRIQTVRTRRYRGFCAHNAEALSEARLIKANRQAFHDVIEDVPALSDSKKRKTHKYLDKFFDATENDKIMEKRVLAACRD